MAKKRKKKWGAFPGVSEQVEASDSTEFVATYRERLGAVEYHLGSLELAARQCSTRVDPQSWHMPEVEGTRYITVFFDPLSIVRVGDFAIREAASVIDTGLLLMNHVLSLGLDATQRVVWRSRNEKLSVRSALVKKVPAEAKLLSALDKIYGSIGYRLLQGYRNWVTHRGAPRIVYAEKTSVFSVFSYEAPEEVLREEEPRKREWLIDRFVNDKLPDEFSVQCWPFVPPVEVVISGQGQDPELVRRGINLGAGVVVQNAMFTIGPLMDDASRFLANNQKPLDSNRALVAGETLAVYSANNYTMAVRHVEHFIEDVVRGEWDDEMASVYSRLTN